MKRRYLSIDEVQRLYDDPNTDGEVRYKVIEPVNIIASDFGACTDSLSELVAIAMSKEVAGALLQPPTARRRREPRPTKLRDLVMCIRIAIVRSGGRIGL